METAGKDAVAVWHLWVTLIGVCSTILCTAIGGIVALWTRLTRIEGKLDGIGERFDQHVKDDDHRFTRVDAALDRAQQQADRLTRLEAQQQAKQGRASV